MSLFNKRSPDAAARDGGASNGGYGISEAVRLMRTLPVEQNVELVVRVIRSTLASMNVLLPKIIEDAEMKEKNLEERMQTLNGEIGELSREIEQRRQEIASLDSELKETATVKERLLLAQRLDGQPVVGAAPPRSPQPMVPAMPMKPNGPHGKNGADLREHAR